MASRSRNKVKILVVGPAKCGKTCISSYVADTTEFTNKEYRPTRGVRILELESADFRIPRSQSEKIIELWDCSGDKKYEPCWPALRLEVDGAVLVADPDKTTGDELLVWYNEFVLKPGLKLDNVMVLLHHTSERTNDSAIADFRLPQQMNGIYTMFPHVKISIRRDPDLKRCSNCKDFFTKKWMRICRSCESHISTVTICSNCALDHHRDHYLEKCYSNIERKNLLWKLREYLKINSPKKISVTPNNYKQKFTDFSNNSDSFSYMKPKSSFPRLRYKKMICQGYVNLFGNNKTSALEYTEII